MAVKKKEKTQASNRWLAGVQVCATNKDTGKKHYRTIRFPDDVLAAEKKWRAEHTVNWSGMQPTYYMLDGTPDSNRSPLIEYLDRMTILMKELEAEEK